MPTVSIVLPSYNGEKYIKESIDSIRKQIYMDWELIIIDDCSTDNTLEIIRQYEKKDYRIRVVHNKENIKLPGTLNIGFSYAKGKYLTWTSDDNMYMPEALAVMVETIEKLDVAMVCADACVIDENGITKPGLLYSHRNEEMCCHNTVGPCFLYRGELRETIGEYDVDLFCVEDYDYWIRVEKKYGNIERINKILYKYRNHEESLSFMYKEKIRLSLIKLREKHLDYILGCFQKKKDLLCAFYYKMIETGTINAKIKKEIQIFVPELGCITNGTKGKYIVFGAGTYGRKALIELDKKVIFFADNAKDKIGKYIGGRKIISFDKMLTLINQYDVMVAIQDNAVYQLIHQLYENGVHAYSTLQSYLLEYKKTNPPSALGE